MQLVNSTRISTQLLDGMVSQYSLMGFFVCNKRHAKKMRIVSLFGCKDYLDQHWCMKSCSSSHRIVGLVLQYLQRGWMDYMTDAASYRMFNDHKGQWALERNRCSHHLNLSRSLDRPFDESVLLWHIATDFCFYSGEFPRHRCAFSKDKSIWSTLLEAATALKKSLPSPRTSSQCGEFTCCKAVQCRQMSNYMMYLLFVNPEMLLPGSRRNLFTTAYNELKGILDDDGNLNLPVEETALAQRIDHQRSQKRKKKKNRPSATTASRRFPKGRFRPRRLVSCSRVVGSG